MTGTKKKVLFRGRLKVAGVTETAVDINDYLERDALERDFKFLLEEVVATIRKIYPTLSVGVEPVGIFVEEIPSEEVDLTVDLTTE